jgi:hypothetical protein
MLASTVQFSRYGRRSNVTLRVHHKVPFEALDAEPSLAITAKKVGYEARSLRTQQCAYAFGRTKDHVPPDSRVGVLMADVR